MTMSHEHISEAYLGRHRVNITHRDAFRDLRGRSPEEIRGVVAILATMRHAGKLPLAATAQVQQDNELAGAKIGRRIPNKFDQFFEQILLDYGNHPEQLDTSAEPSLQASASDDDVLDPPLGA